MKHSGIRPLSIPLVQNIAILLLVIAGAANIGLALPHSPHLLEALGLYYGRLMHHTVVVHRALSVMTGILLLLVAFRLFKRLRFAWFIAMGTLLVSMVLEVFRFGSPLNPMSLLDLTILVVLGAGWRDFSRRSEPIRVRQALLLSAGSLTLVLLFTASGLYMNRGQYHGIENFADSLTESIRLLFLMDIAAADTSRPVGLAIARTAIILNWASLLGGLFLILKPLVYTPLHNRLELSKARELVERHGGSPIAHLALESDKKWFFGSRADGVIAFDVAADVAVCCGDMICADEDAWLLLTEFLLFCRQNHWHALFLNVTDRFLPQYLAAGFSKAKYGEDAMFRLSDYTLAGGRVAKVRAAVNHATKAGITVSEYQPVVRRESAIEAEIRAISDEWLSTKKSGELAFMLGGLGLENPMGSRYFLARSPEGRLLGFMVFLPFDGGKGYLADVTRRRSDAPQGVLEKILVEAFAKMRAEGVEWGSLGLAPLANVQEDPQSGMVGQLFQFVYERLNQLYGFKSLHHAKEKYAPTDWVSRWIVWHPARFNPRMAYAIVKVQNPKGVSDYLLSMLRRQFDAEGAGPAKGTEPG